MFASTLTSHYIVQIHLSPLCLHNPPSSFCAILSEQNAMHLTGQKRAPSTVQNIILAILLMKRPQPPYTLLLSNSIEFNHKTGETADRSTVHKPIKIDRSNENHYSAVTSFLHRLLAAWLCLRATTVRTWNKHVFLLFRLIELKYFRRISYKLNRFLLLQGIGKRMTSHSPEHANKRSNIGMNFFGFSDQFNISFTQVWCFFNAIHLTFQAI